MKGGIGKPNPLSYVYNMKNLNTEQFDYMDGLILIKQGINFDNAVRSFIIDLVGREGFEMSDVKAFVETRMEMIFDDFKDYDQEIYLEKQKLIRIFTP